MKRKPIRTVKFTFERTKLVTDTMVVFGSYTTMRKMKPKTVLHVEMTIPPNTANCRL